MLPRCALLSLCLVIAVVGAAAAQGFNGGLGVGLRVDGIVGPPADAVVLGTLSIRAGDRLLNFGVRTAQTSMDEGMSIFRGVIQYPENLRLIGPPELLQPFYAATPGTRIRMLGLFKPDIRWLLVGEIQVVEPPAPLRNDS